MNVMETMAFLLSFRRNQAISATEWLKFRQKLWNLANPSLYGPTYSYVSHWSNIKSFTISAADWRRLLYIQLENGSECCLLEDVLEHTKNLSHKHGQTRLGTTLLRFPLVSRFHAYFALKQFRCLNQVWWSLQMKKTFWESPRALNYVGIKGVYCFTQILSLLD